ncbi:MAG: SDR family oxidoreductase [Opitutales bacterium]
MKKILVTGASGLLGRAIRGAFEAIPDWSVIGLAKNRVRDGLFFLDLLDPRSVREFLFRKRPHVVIHAAAERKPDICEHEPDYTKALNVTATSTLCAAAREVGAWTLFTSTDYVFDGTNPPYRPEDQPNPLNSYGESKLAGEQAVLSADPENAVLRIPILYGGVESLEESAVTAVASLLLDPSPMRVDHWAVRRPTHVGDVAAACMEMTKLRAEGKSCSGVWHFSGDEAMTKYDMAMAMAKILDRDASHLFPEDKAPHGAPRPHDCSLDCTAFDLRFTVARSRFQGRVGAILKPHLTLNP